MKTSVVLLAILLDKWRLFDSITFLFGNLLIHEPLKIFNLLEQSFNNISDIYDIFYSFSDVFSIIFIDLTEITVVICQHSVSILIFFRDLFPQSCFNLIHFIFSLIHKLVIGSSNKILEVTQNTSIALFYSINLLLNLFSELFISKLSDFIMTWSNWFLNDF